MMKNQIEWNSGDFFKPIERTKSTSDEASEKLGHNPVLYICI
ncbi:MAG: hypothetical protein HEEMFOPI_01213 [Holosporales bacterium]